MSKYDKTFGSHLGVDGNSPTVQQDVFFITSRMTLILPQKHCLPV